jgi:hypothetical protein
VNPVVCRQLIAIESAPLAGLVPAIHVFLNPGFDAGKTWTAGSSPAEGLFEARFPYVGTAKQIVAR